MAHMDHSFENLCIVMQEAGVTNPKELTKFEFEERINYFIKKNQPKSKPQIP